MMAGRTVALWSLLLLGTAGAFHPAPLALPAGGARVGSHGGMAGALTMARGDKTPSDRREALARGAAALGGLVLPQLTLGQPAAAELTPWANEIVKDSGIVPGMQGTEINGKFVETDCRGARGKRCNVWQPPEIDTTPLDDGGVKGKITAKAYFDVRVVTDYTNEVLEKGVKRGRIVVGLYGNDAPKTVEQFSKFVKGGEDYPCYSSGMFFRHEPGRWLEGGRINGLSLGEFGGQEVYEYQSRIVNLKPILELNPIKHTRRGLLTHSKLNPGPEFAVTLRPTPELDGAWTVFGEVLEGEDMVVEIQNLPFVTGKSLDPSGSIADNWWKAQKSYFEGVAKAFGDSRVGKAKTGKLLRRVEIASCGFL